MVPELEKASVTELQVRIDCNGCMQKIKKAMHNVDGIYDYNIDVAQQKLTVVGRADPEKILKVIKKTRKMATICSHTEPSGEPANPEKPATEPAAPDAAGQPPAEALPAEPEPPKELPKENPEPEVKPSPEAKDASPEEPKDVGEVHMVHYYPHNYVYREHYHPHEAPYYVTHSYSSYRPSIYAPRYGYKRYYGAEAYDASDYYHNYRQGNEDNNVTSAFSDENPNACRIA